jgi:hypothetical protein
VDFVQKIGQESSWSADIHDASSAELTVIIDIIGLAEHKDGA